MLDLSQQDIATQMSSLLTVQELDAYERGLLEISTSQLYQLSEILHIPMAYFLKDI